MNINGDDNKNIGELLIIIVMEVYEGGGGCRGRGVNKCRSKDG